MHRQHLKETFVILADFYFSIFTAYNYQLISRRSSRSSFQPSVGTPLKAVRCYFGGGGYDL